DPSSGPATSPVRRGSALSRSQTMIEGMPSGMVMKRRMTSPCWKMLRIIAGLAEAGSMNSPALIGSPLPKIFARSRKLSAEPISPSSSSFFATEVSEVPEGTTNGVSSSTSAGTHQPQATTAPEANPSRATTAATRNPLRRIPMSASDLLDHQAGVGAAEAEAVVEHRPHLPLLGLVRHEVHAFAAFRRIIEVQRGRDDLVA